MVVIYDSYMVVKMIMAAIIFTQQLVYRLAQNFYGDKF